MQERISLSVYRGGSSPWLLRVKQNGAEHDVALWVANMGKILPQAIAIGTAVPKVEDTGPGFPEGAQVFERFYRAETSRGRAGGGSGLGLAIVRTLVELHGGRVEAHNRVGGGAAFHVTLPRVQEAQTSTKMLDRAQNK